MCVDDERAHALTAYSPQYIEIYQLKQVIGISLFFMLVDMAGGVFSVISLVFRESLDILAVVG